MTRILLNKATRIEGNASVRIEVDGDQVRSARFMVQDFRGFETFLQERRIESIPQLVSRICGLCSVSHQIASVAAIEDALGCEVAPSVAALRKAALYGEWIASHAVSYFFLTVPDFVGATGGLVDLMKSHPKLAEDALKLRRDGQRIVEIIGKRSVHPVSIRIGGFSTELTDEDVDAVRSAAEDARERAMDLAIRAAEIHLDESDIRFPADHQVNLVAFDEAADEFWVRDQGGRTVARFPRREFADNVDEVRADWSFAKFPYLRELGFPAGIMLVGPLARAKRPDGPLQHPSLAQLELVARLKKHEAVTLGSYDACRLLELVWATHQVSRLLEDLDTSGQQVEFDVRAEGSGVGVVEAPRGTLVHSYEVSDGLLVSMRLLVATQFNNAFINMQLKDIVSSRLVDGSVSSEGERLVGRAIRMFDPCLSCATH